MHKHATWMSNTHPGQQLIFHFDVFVEFFFYIFHCLFHILGLFLLYVFICMVRILFIYIQQISFWFYTPIGGFLGDRQVYYIRQPPIGEKDDYDS